MLVPLTLERRKSAETGKLYSAICADLGYRKVNLAVDPVLIAELLDLSPRKLFLLFEASVSDPKYHVSEDELSIPIGEYSTDDLVVL